MSAITLRRLWNHLHIGNPAGRRKLQSFVETVDSHSSHEIILSITCSAICREIQVGRRHEPDRISKLLWNLSRTRHREPVPAGRDLRFEEHLISNDYTYAYARGGGRPGRRRRPDLSSSDCGTKGSRLHNAFYWYENDGSGKFRRHYIAREDWQGRYDGTGWRTSTRTGVSTWWGSTISTATSSGSRTRATRRRPNRGRDTPSPAAASWGLRRGRGRSGRGRPARRGRLQLAAREQVHLVSESRPVAA